MTIWRPASHIRVKALGLHWRGDALLAAEVLTDSGQVKGVRPLGGTVEFGETAEQAVIREFKEELDLAITVQGSPIFFENLYHHEGAQGHEIVAVFDVAFPNGAFDGVHQITFYEDNGTACTARWFNLDTLDLPGGPELYPAGLKAALLAHHSPRG